MRHRKSGPFDSAQSRLSDPRRGMEETNTGPEGPSLPGAADGFAQHSDFHPQQIPEHLSTCSYSFSLWINFYRSPKRPITSAATASTSLPPVSMRSAAVM